MSLLILKFPKVAREGSLLCLFARQGTQRGSKQCLFACQGTQQGSKLMLFASPAAFGEKTGVWVYLSRNGLMND